METIEENSVLLHWNDGPLRNITHIESLRIVVETLFDSLKKMALAGILLIFAILGVRLFSGRLHNRCIVDLYTIWECDSTINSNNNNINNGTNSICDSCECTINVTQDTDYNSFPNAIWSNITEDMNYRFCTPELGNDLCSNQDIRYAQCASIAPNPDSGVTNFDYFGWAFLQTFVIAILDFLQVMRWSQDTFSTSVSYIHFFTLTSFLAYVALNIVLAIIIYSFQNANESGQGNKIFTILEKEREILTNALKNNHEQYKEMEQGYDIDIEIKTSNDNDNYRDLEIDNKQDNKPEANDTQTQDDGDTQPDIGASIKQLHAMTYSDSIDNNNNLNNKCHTSNTLETVDAHIVQNFTVKNTEHGKVPSQLLVQTLDGSSSGQMIVSFDTMSESPVNRTYTQEIEENNDDNQVFINKQVIKLLKERLGVDKANEIKDSQTNDYFSQLCDTYDGMKEKLAIFEEYLSTSTTGAIINKNFQLKQNEMYITDLANEKRMDKHIINHALNRCQEHVQNNPLIDSLLRIFDIIIALLFSIEMILKFIVLAVVEQAFFGDRKILHLKDDINSDFNETATNELRSIAIFVQNTLELLVPFLVDYIKNCMREKKQQEDGGQILPRREPQEQMDLILLMI